MIEIEIEKGDLPGEGVVVVILGHDGSLSSAASQLDERTSGLLRRAVEASGKLKHGRVLDLFLPQGVPFERVALLVLGKTEPLKHLDLEEAGAMLFSRLDGLRIERAALASAEGLDLGFEPAVVQKALATGALLKSYRFTKYQKPKDDEPTRLKRLVLMSGSGDLEVEPVLAQVRAVSFARDLVSEPANILSPTRFAERCRELEPFGIEVEILSEARLKELGMGAILAVGQGSAEESCAVIMQWRGGGDAPPLALVGKGVCFDSGGISIKPASGMEDMKWDMGGAAAVVGAMQALAARKAKANIVGIIGLTENMPSGTAQRPGDVIKTYSGTTVEVVNTDAEGRLVLADMLWYVKERFKPRAMVDLATLTGAVIIALGHEMAGLFASDDELARRIEAAGEATGEKVWRLPLGKAYDKHIESAIADIKNVGRSREASSTAAAVFLQRFVGDVPWAHLDIAAMAWTTRDLALAAKGGTGFGVRLLDRLVADVYEAGAA